MLLPQHVRIMMRMGSVLYVHVFYLVSLLRQRLRSTSVRKWGHARRSPFLYASLKRGRTPDTSSHVGTWALHGAAAVETM
jgi:hypothetical protein